MVDFSRETAPCDHYKTNMKTFFCHFFYLRLSCVLYAVGKLTLFRIVLLLLVPTGSKERGVLGSGVFLLQYFPLVNIYKILHRDCIDMNIVG